PRKLDRPAALPRGCGIWASSSHSPLYPTHALEITGFDPSSASPSSETPVTIFYVHDIVLRAHCGSLPDLPPPGLSAHLPVVRLSLPSAQAFPALHAFMYTHRLDSVLQFLLPLPRTFLATCSHLTVLATLRSSASCHQLAVHVWAAAGKSLKDRVSCIIDLWKDMVVLQLRDPELWDTLDLVWEVVLLALDLSY
ncbi:hypothetical protein C8J57DRAFT_1012005, partial [Mycena rebaudengoi]